MSQYESVFKTADFARGRSNVAGKNPLNTNENSQIRELYDLQILINR